MSTTASKIILLHTAWHEEIVDNLLHAATQVFENTAWETHPHEVAGSYELPLAAKQHLLKTNVAAVVALGCVITGETKHATYINHACAQGLMQVSLELLKPIGFGVITADNYAQAQARSLPNKKNKGREAAQAVLHTLKQQ